MQEVDYDVPGHFALGSPGLYITRGKQAQKEGRLLAATADFGRAFSAPGVDAATKQEASTLTAAVMRLRSVIGPFEKAFRAHEWEQALKVLERVPQAERTNARVLLMEARCHQQLGKFSNAQRAAARVLEAAASYGSWKRGEPRMMAVTMGSGAAMEMGNSAKALKFYKTVLKFDPDQKEVRKQYKKLKELTALLDDAETQVTKGYNHKAVDLLDEVLGKLRGMDVDSNVFRSTILLKLCRAKAAMKQHEEALTHCEDAYEALSTPMPGMVVDPHKLREAQEARAEAYMKDFNYDDAVTDLRAALGASSGEKQQEVQKKLNEAQEAQRKWRCVDPTDRKTWQDNRCGMVRRPTDAGPSRPRASRFVTRADPGFSRRQMHANNGRDHKAVLELPANLDEIPKEKQCDWIKKQYKKLAKKCATTWLDGVDSCLRAGVCGGQVAPGQGEGFEGACGAEDERCGGGEYGAQRAARMQEGPPRLSKHSCLGSRVNTARPFSLKHTYHTLVSSSFVHPK